ncbi:hypothetical protein [Pantoea anthophila]|uniref:hypothetical protein n=1 Tax=Pantoea anthophila TaxID=470931 RepID=UPI00301CA081
MSSIRGCVIEGVETGIIFPANANIDIASTSVKKCKVGMFAFDKDYDVEKYLRALSNHQKEFDDLKHEVSSLRTRKPKLIRRVIKMSSIAALLSTSSDLTTVVDFLMAQLKNAGII